MSYRTFALIDVDPCFDSFVFFFSFDDDVSDEETDQLHKRFQELLPEALEQISQLCEMTLTSKVIPLETKGIQKGSELAYKNVLITLRDRTIEGLEAKNAQLLAENARLIHKRDQRDH